MLQKNPLCFVFLEDKRLWYPASCSIWDAIAGLTLEDVAFLIGRVTPIGIPLHLFVSPQTTMNENPFEQDARGKGSTGTTHEALCFFVQEKDIPPEMGEGRVLPIRSLLAELHLSGTEWWGGYPSEEYPSSQASEKEGHEGNEKGGGPFEDKGGSVFSGGGQEKRSVSFIVSRFLRVFHLFQWLNVSRYCGRCGTQNNLAPDEMARLCPACGRREYPRISPAVMVAVTDDDNRLLLAHNAHFRAGMYSVIAGFVEAGETLEAAAYREVLEETGIIIDRIQYVASQSWPFPDALMVGFTAHAQTTTIQVDNREILDARFYSHEELPDIPLPGSLSRVLIERWLAQHRGRSPYHQ